MNSLRMTSLGVPHRLAFRAWTGMWRVAGVGMTRLRRIAHRRVAAGAARREACDRPADVPRGDATVPMPVSLSVPMPVPVPVLIPMPALSIQAASTPPEPIDAGSPLEELMAAQAVLASHGDRPGMPWRARETAVTTPRVSAPWG